MQTPLRTPAIVPATEWAELDDLDRAVALGLGFMPGMAGADDDPPADDTADDSDDDSSDDDRDDTDDTDGDDDDTEVARAKRDAEKAKREAADAKRRAAEAERKRKQLERKLREHESGDAQRQGNYKKLYEQEQEEAKTLREQVEALTRKIREGARDREIASVATDMKAKVSTKRIVRMVRDELPDDVVDDDGNVDTQAIKDALKALKKDEPDLFEQAKAQTTDAGRGDRSRNGNGQPTPMGPGTGMNKLRDHYASSMGRN